jgi:RNA polymerase sigma factor (sigma-70 family)
MQSGCAHRALRQVARVFRDGTLTGLSDRQLLARFVESRDEAAFESLLLRHGPMVLNVCRRLLRDPADAEDCVQAVFLVLVRKARSIRVEESLGPWLYAVAVRAASRARAQRRARREREVSAVEGITAPAIDDRLGRLELTSIVHEELARLPGRLRVPLVLCYMEGMTHDRAAGEIGCPVGTVRSRLARARGLLQNRMARRGLALSAAAVVAAIDSSVTAAAIPAGLRASLITTAARSISQAALTSGVLGVSASVLALTQGVTHMFRIKKLAIGAFVLGSVSVVGFVLAQQSPGDGVIAPTTRVLPSQPYETRELGPDGRPIGVVHVPRDAMITIAYYVGDLVGTPLAQTATQPSPDQSAAPAAVQARVDMMPLVRFIATTVAPGTWDIRDENGGDPTAVTDRARSSIGQGGQSKPMGSIIPFFLSISLVVRCTAETHTRVAHLLRGMRDVVNARDANAQRPVPPLPPIATRPSPARKVVPSMALDSAAPAAKPDAAQEVGSPVASEPSARIERLLDELRTEIAKLPKRSD